MSPTHTKQVHRLPVRRDSLGHILPLACVLALSHGLRASGQPNDWITFTDETWRIDTTNPEVGSMDQEEKDMVVVDLDLDGDQDLVVVRKAPFTTPGARCNVLYMNELDNGVRKLVDRTEKLAPGFMDLTQDRDVVAANIDGDVAGLMDIVTASVSYPCPTCPSPDLPRVYINRGCCRVACGPAPCPPGDERPCPPGVGEAVAWCGLHYDENENRIPTFSPAPNFCGVAAGDVDGNGTVDLYFVDYDNSLEDRLLINRPAEAGSQGFFDDMTTTLMTDPAMYNSGFGTGAAIVDINVDGFNDIVKSEAGSVDIIYHNGLGNGLGRFDEWETIEGTLKAYMVGAGALDDVPGIDLYIIKDTVDGYLLNDGAGNLTTHGVQSQRTAAFGGNVRFADLDGDGRDDVLVSDIDVRNVSCDRQLALLRNHGGSPFSSPQTICDPFRVVTEPAWLTRGTFDTAVIAEFDNLLPALWCGTCTGNSLFIREQGVAPFVDCNNNSVTDACDISTFSSLDCDGSGIPDECTGGFQSCGCGDGLVCTFDDCPNGQCRYTGALYADVSGSSSGDGCGPDGDVNLGDILGELNAFSGIFRGCCGVGNHDIRGVNGSCAPDGVVGLTDILSVLDAFAGIDPCCSGGPGPPPCPPDLDDPIIIFDPTPIYPLFAQPGDPIIAFEVDVHVYTSGQLRGYQVDLEITGAQANHAVISDISVDQSKPTYIFSAAPSGDVDVAVDLSGLRMMSAVRSGGVNIRSYLMTFRLDRAPGAPQSFTVTVRTKPQTQIADPNGCGDSPDIITEIFEFE